MSRACLTVNEPEGPTRNGSELIQKHLLKGKDLPWVNNMSAAWVLVERMAELQEDDVISMFSGPHYVPSHVPTSDMVLSDDEKGRTVLPDKVENGPAWAFFFVLPRESEEDDPVTCDLPDYDFVHEKPEMAIYAAALKLSELLRDGVVPRKWLEEKPPDTSIDENSPKNPS